MDYRPDQDQYDQSDIEFEILDIDACSMSLNDGRWQLYRTQV